MIYEEMNRISENQRRRWNLSNDPRFANSMQAFGSTFHRVCEFDEETQQFLSVPNLYYNPSTNRFKVILG